MNMEKNYLSESEYQNKYPHTFCSVKDTLREKAFAKAWEVRDYEIKLYWERAKYFWAFIASTFVGYFGSLGDIADGFHELQFIMVCIGFAFSFSWVLVNIGSKHWQENWEGHIDRLEDNFTGPLYKTVKTHWISFSVSKINIAVSLFICAIWVLLGYVYYLKYLTFVTGKPTATIENASILITGFFIVAILCYGRSGSFKTKTHYRIRNID